MHEANQTKTALARKLGIARSSLYYKPKKPPADAENKQRIVAVMQKHPAYGSRRVAMALGINRKKSKRLMQLSGLKPALRRGQRPYKPHDIGKPETVVKNSLKGLCPIQPNVVWAGDFTYIWFVDRFWYLATVIDIHAREIVGWHIANHHTTALIMEAFTDAIKRTNRAPTYFHSDQGSEYIAERFNILLAEHEVMPSHSKKSSPWQNGHQESFYNNFKLELGKPHQFNSVGELIAAIHQQITYYNHKRIHTALKMSPVQFKQQQLQQQTIVQP